MTTLFAQPYDITANGFYFESFEEYTENADKNTNDFGFPVEEYEIQFIDGECIDAALFKALDVHQGTIEDFFTACDDWDDFQKQKVIIAVGDCGYTFDLHSGHPDDFDVDIYYLDNLKELAEQFVDEGLFGDIPDNIRSYLDYDAIAYDLGMDYTEITIAGERLIYRAS